MINSPRNYAWIPYCVAFVGIICSLLMGYLMRHDLPSEFQIGIVRFIENYQSLFAAGTGIIITLLLTFALKLAMAAQNHALALAKLNADMQKEISDRIAAEAENKKLEGALIEGQKLQAIGTLAGGIAHDFNNILYAIIGYVELALEDLPAEGLIHRNLSKVVAASKRGQELVARILSFSRRQQPQKLDLINLKHAFETALSLLRPTVPAGVNLTFDCHKDLFISGNQTKLHQVIVNLVNNAVDAMDGEGKVDIQIDRVDAQAADLKDITNIAAKNYCRIVISDTGSGMDQATIDRIFEPFFTTKEVGKGTGLGLSIVHSIIKEHQGEIRVSSKLGEGTQFNIFLPEAI